MSFKQSKKLRKEVEEWFKLILFIIAAAIAAHTKFEADHAQVRNVPEQSQVQDQLPPPTQDQVGLK